MGTIDPRSCPVQRELGQANANATKATPHIAMPAAAAAAARNVAYWAAVARDGSSFSTQNRSPSRQIM